jgi:hypothetical protein
MPTYVYVKPNGELIELFMSVKAMRKLQDKDGWIRLEDGTTAQRTFQGMLPGVSSTYPKKSDAMGVHPSQVKEARAADERLGVPIQYEKTGEAVYESATQRKKHCEAHGFYDRNGGYSDPQKRK